MSSGQVIVIGLLLVIVAATWLAWPRVSRFSARMQYAPIVEPEYAPDAVLVSYAVTTYQTQYHKQRLSGPPINAEHVAGEVVDNVRVERIRVDDTALKLFALVTFRYLRDPRPKPSGGRKYTYTGVAILGTRASPSAVWDLFWFTDTTLISYDAQDEVGKDLVRSYYEGMKGQSVPEGVRDEQGGRKKAYYTFNASEDGFWRDIMWEKGTRLPGLFTFQAALGDARQADPWVEVQPLVASYPDEILKAFTG